MTRTGSGGISVTMWAAAAPSLEGQRQHPAVRGLADGSLSDERFARFMVQDCLFIVDYSRALSLAAARAPTPEVGGRFAAMATRLVNNELELNEDLARELGVTEAELKMAVPDPVTRAYTDFLLRVAALEDFGVVAAAFLPCFWGYSEMGRALVAGPPSPNPRYARWLEAYADDGFADTAAWCRELVDEHGEQAGDGLRKRMLNAFVVSSHLEHSFWNVIDADGGLRFEPTPDPAP